MPRKPKPKFDESRLTKGHLRKLNALRKSLGHDIANLAFAEWLETVGAEPAPQDDKNAQLIADALAPLISKNQLRIPRGGYVLRRGRRRVTVSRPEA